MSAYYNEIDPYAAAWLRNLIAAGEIADGEVDERSIEDITPAELRGFTQCHFFAGIGIWSLALRRAGWCDTRPIWTGSCPCQPFSTAGKGDGFDDERHLWPHWNHLIEHCNPDVVMGEQVASKDGLAWLDLVSSDMEATGHAFWPVDICAAGVGAPQIRQRLYWVVYADHARSQRWLKCRNGSGERFAGPNSLGDGMGCANSEVIRGRPTESYRPQTETGHRSQSNAVGSSGDVLQRLANTDGGERDRWSEAGERHIANWSNTGWSQGDSFTEPHRVTQRLADTDGDGRQETGDRFTATRSDGFIGNTRIPSAASAALPVNGSWRNADWIFGTDGYFRPVEPGTFPLVDGHPCRMEQISAYGNAICADQAQAFIESVM